MDSEKTTEDLVYLLKPIFKVCECGMTRNINVAPICPVCAAKNAKREGKKYAKVNGSKSKHER